jgi:hypothetical protein
MILKLKAKHFRGTKYTDNYNCAIAKALKELITHTNIKRVAVEPNEIVVWPKGEVMATRFVLGAPYMFSNFMWDKLKSRFVKDEVVLRTVRIIDFHLKDYTPEPELSDITIDSLIQENHISKEQLKLPI